VYLRQKCEQYKRKIVEYKAQLEASGYTAEVCVMAAHSSSRALNVCDCTAGQPSSPM
jgi:hypothetical protein